MTRTFLPVVLFPILAAVGAGCAAVDHPVVVHPAEAPSAKTWEAVLAKPGVITHRTVISARWEVPLSGMVNLDHPNAKAAGLVDTPVKIVLPVHILTHPTHGAWIIDTGVPRVIEPSNMFLNDFLASLVTIEPIEDIVKGLPAPLGGVLLTHFHLDHIIGIPGLPPGTKIFMGPGDTEVTSVMNAVTRDAFQTAVEGRGPLQQWDFTHGVSMGPIESAIDIFGDGSLWALHTPGHTPGSTAYFAMTTSGPILFTGDTSHTLWGWENNVEPGEYTQDHPANQKSLAALKTLAKTYPTIKVFVGHETDGVGTGVFVPPATTP